MTPRILLLPLLAACAAPDDQDALVTGLVAAQVEDFAPMIRVSWLQREPGTAALRFRTDGGDWQEAPPRQRGAGPAAHHVIGPTFDQEVELTLIVEVGGEQWESAPLVVQTGPPPDAFPLPVLDISVPEKWDPAASYLLGSTHEGVHWSSAWWLFLVDRGGHVIWSHRSVGADAQLTWISRHVSLSDDRDAILVDRSTAWTLFDGGAASTVAVMTLDGAVSHLYETPGLHHPYTALPGGEVAWGARDLDDESTESIQVVGLDGAQRELWRCEADCGSNTLWWDGDRRRLLYSFWSSETIAEIDADTGALVRRFGHAEDAWGFSPSESAFWWQHGPNYTDAGTLLVSTKAGPSTSETVVREYALDADAGLLEEIWSAGEGRGHYAGFGGEAWRLPGGNTLHGNGSGGRLTEYAPDGSVAWEAHWPFRRIGQTAWLADPYDLIP